VPVASPHKLGGSLLLYWSVLKMLPWNLPHKAKKKPRQRGRQRGLTLVSTRLADGSRC
jgi:hypothetical protein